MQALSLNERTNDFYDSVVRGDSTANNNNTSAMHPSELDDHCMVG